MSAYSTSRSSTSSSNGFLSTLMTAVSAWNDARVTRKSLAKLSDRELDDIGLCRGDIDSIASAR